MEIRRVGDTNLVIESEELGFGSGAIKPDLYGRCGDAKPAAGLFELQRFGRGQRRPPGEDGLEDGEEGFMLCRGERARRVGMDCCADASA